jgi:hypothetical protein
MVRIVEVFESTVAHDLQTILCAFVLDNLQMTWQRSCVATAAKKTIPPIPEHLEQYAMVRWANLFRHLYPELRPLQAIPNGGIANMGKRTPRSNNEQALRLAGGQTDPNSTACLPNAVPMTHTGQAETAGKKTDAPR